MARQGDENPDDGLRAFSPFLDPAERRELTDLLAFEGQAPPSFADALRKLARSYVDEGGSAKLRAICLLVADLFEQGWRVTLREDRILFEPPGIATSDEHSVEDVKARIRSSLNAARRRQLGEASVAGFLRRMERRTLRPNGVRSSVLDVIDDGADLAARLAEVAEAPAELAAEELAKLIDPVVEICRPGSRCSETGLPLNDIWRYFRHTWAHEYRPIPGRQLLVLIRNAARRGRPVMGIAMLASPVMRVAARDNWIGWLREPLEARLRAGTWSAEEVSAALTKRLEDSIAEVRWDDLATPGEVGMPTENAILRLEQKASGAAFARSVQLRAHYEANVEAGGQVTPMRGGPRLGGADCDWLEASEDLLFVRKRADLLAQLLFARQMFRASSLETDPGRGLEQLLAARSGQRAIDIVLAEFRKAGLSSRVADVSICGAVAPYNELLAGKLVALLLASSEVRESYRARYDGQVSVIASQMAGRAICRPADLRILTTTSLYGVGSSQYNRLQLRPRAQPGLDAGISWDSIGRSRTGGFGTLHLGTETAEALREMAQRLHVSRRVNNRFGEGTSPRLRQIREGLDALGIQSDTVLHHATPRLFYACELGENSRRSLLGLASDEQDAPSSAAIGAAWRSRWLVARARRPETLAALAGLGPQSVLRSLRPESEPDLLTGMSG